MEFTSYGLLLKGDQTYIFRISQTQLKRRRPCTLSIEKRDEKRGKTSKGYHVEASAHFTRVETGYKAEQTV